MLDEDLQGDPDQDQAAGDLDAMLTDPAEPLARPRPRQHGRTDDHRNRRDQHDDRNDGQRERKLHEERLCAGERGEDQDGIDQPRVQARVGPARAHHAVDHLPADPAKQHERDPVVEGGQGLGQPQAGHPGDREEKGEQGLRQARGRAQGGASRRRRVAAAAPDEEIVGRAQGGHRQPEQDDRTDGQRQHRRQDAGGARKAEEDEDPGGHETDQRIRQPLAENDADADADAVRDHHSGGRAQEDGDRIGVLDCQADGGELRLVAELRQKERDGDGEKRAEAGARLVLSLQRVATNGPEPKEDEGQGGRQRDDVQRDDVGEQAPRRDRQGVVQEGGDEHRRQYGRRGESRGKGHRQELGLVAHLGESDEQQGCHKRRHVGMLLRVWCRTRGSTGGGMCGSGQVRNGWPGLPRAAVGERAVPSTEYPRRNHTTRRDRGLGIAAKGLTGPTLWKTT